jgi:hypothetical protein
MLDRDILACVPRDRSELPQFPGLDDIKVTDLYTLRQCENRLCRQDVWVGPRQMATYKQDPARFYVLCYLCALAAQRQYNEAFDPDSDIRQLGGGSTTEGRPRIT